MAGNKEAICSILCGDLCEMIGRMNAPFIREFLSATLWTLVGISLFSVGNALRKVQPRQRPEWAKRISQPVAAVILFAVVAAEIYWWWSPSGLGTMAGIFLTIPLERFVMLVKRTVPKLTPQNLSRFRKFTCLHPLSSRAVSAVPARSDHSARRSDPRQKLRQALEKLRIVAARLRSRH